MELLNKLYNDPITGFVGKRKLYEKAKQINKDITMKDINAFFEQNETDKVFKKPKKKTEIPITGPINGIQCDLIFLPYPRQNRGYNTILTAVGINSRIGYAIPMKGKTSTASLEAMKELVERAKEKGKPFYLVESDNGSEFINKSVEKYLEEQEINHIMSDQGNHNFMGKIERFNRTLKLMISKYMKAKNTTKWIDVIDKLVENYNNSYHSSIEKTPNEVSEEDEQRIIDDAVNKFIHITKDLFKGFSIGDTVRILNKRGTFEKEGQRWSDEIYKIVEINATKARLQNSSGNLLRRSFGPEQLLKASQNVSTPAVEEEKQHSKTMRKLQKEGLTKNDVLLSKVTDKLKQLIKDGVIEKGIEIKISDKPDKKLMAVLKDGKIVYFGAKDSLTYLEGADEKKRDSYRARASKIKLKNNKFAYKKQYSPSWFSWWILW